VVERTLRARPLGITRYEFQCMLGGTPPGVIDRSAVLRAQQRVEAEHDRLVARAVAARPGSPEEAAALEELDRFDALHPAPPCEPLPGWEDRSMDAFQSYLGADRMRRIAIAALAVAAVIAAATAIAYVASSTSSTRSAARRGTTGLDIAAAGASGGVARDRGRARDRPSWISSTRSAASVASAARWRPSWTSRRSATAARRRSMASGAATVAARHRDRGGAWWWPSSTSSTRKPTNAAAAGRRAAARSRRGQNSSSCRSRRRRVSRPWGGDAERRRARAGAGLEQVLGRGDRRRRCRRTRRARAGAVAA